MEFNPNDLSYMDSYKLLIGSIQPRPIAWVSSLSADGLLNLAPFSFFAPVCANPPTLVFSPNIRRQTGIAKDTLANIRETGEFVVNIVTEDMAEKMNLTSADLPSRIDEFEEAGLTPVTSTVVETPRVAESPISMECRLFEIVDIGKQIGQASLVIGSVVYFHIDDSVYMPDYKIDTMKLKPLARLAGSTYAKITETFDLERPGDAKTFVAG